MLDLPDATRGFKYWIWKPVIALAAMQDMADGEVLYYTNGRSQITGVLPWVLDFISSCADIGALYMEENVEQAWTRADVMAEFSVAVDLAHALSGQFMATTWCIRKTAAALALLTRWQEFMRAHYEMCSFGPSALPNAACFRDNRNDQSVWSLLLKTSSDVLVHSTLFSKLLAYHPQVYRHP